MTGSQTTRPIFRAFHPVWVLILAGAMARAGDLPARPDFADDVQPLLKARCTKCHGPNHPKGKLNLSNARGLARGGESGPVIEPGAIDESGLWDQVASGTMPPESEEPLSDDEKMVLRRWIEQGAKGLPRPEELKGTVPGADHWAFAPARRPAPPEVRDARRVRTPLDRFIQSALEAKGLGLGPEADRATLLRRMSLDLTGLPPAPDEIDAFVNDHRADAHERMVERLLASPAYGERWGKYWLDAMGYVESNGYFSADSDRPLAYRYRDYVIRAFNDDRPLDRIVREQLAGDELSGYGPGVEITPALVDQLAATHYLRNGQDGTGESDGNPDEVRADKVAVLDGAVQIIGSSLLGLTLQCAKCHDHKFEPVTQKEYYELQAILAPAFNLEKWVKPNDRYVEAAPRAVLAPWEAHEEEIDAEVARLKKEMAPGPKDSAKDREAKQKKLDEALQKANGKRQPHPGRIAWVSDLGPEPVGTPLFLRGNPSTPGPTVGPGVPAVLTDPDNRLDVQPPRPGAKTTGRRLALARWLTRPGSRPAALLARIMANRIWQDHFGVGLVATSDNLGYTGAATAHLDLLDALASELVRSGWSAKAMHRLILNSGVWRQSSAPRPEAGTIDPENRLLARFPLRRLDAETVRDTMLAVSGELDRQPFGPSVPTHRAETGEVVPVEPEGSGLRRSVYLQTRRTQVSSLLEVFDAPSIVTTCTRRLPATIPLQSLSLLNSEFVVARASKLAARLEDVADSSDDLDGRLTRAFRLAIGRPPDDRERAASVSFLHAQPARYSDRPPAEAGRRAWADLCQMILASNAFLYVE
jgi:hypothetical protein